MRKHHVEKRERDFRKINRFAVPAYLAANLLLAGVNAMQSLWYYAVLALCALLLPLILSLFYRIIRRRRSYQLDLLVYLYVFLLYTLGIVMRLYSLTSYYDKLAHTLSGIVIALFGLLLFHLLSPEKTMERARFPLAAVFVMAVVTAVAGIWEIWEFIVSLIFHSDPQRVLTTGVADTMLDMIVCVVGGAAFLPSLWLYMSRGKTFFLLGIFEAACRLPDPKESNEK